MRGYASPIQKDMSLITPNSPAYYLTSVTKDRLPAFRLDTLKSVVCNALAEARTSGGFLIFAYVIMPDHLHLISDSENKPAKVLQFINGVVSRRVIDFLKQHGHNSSLKKTPTPRISSRTQILTLGSPSKCSPADKREYAHGACSLHPSESRQSRPCEKSGRLSLLKCANLEWNTP